MRGARELRPVACSGVQAARPASAAVWHAWRGAWPRRGGARQRVQERRRQGCAEERCPTCGPCLSTQLWPAAEERVEEHVQGCAACGGCFSSSIGMINFL